MAGRGDTCTANTDWLTCSYVNGQSKNFSFQTSEKPDVFTSRANEPSALGLPSRAVDGCGDALKLERLLVPGGAKAREPRCFKCSAAVSSLSSRPPVINVFFPTTSTESEDGEGGAGRRICHRRSFSVAVATCHSDEDNDGASEAWKAPSRTQDRPSGATITALLHLARSQNSLFRLVASLCFMSSTLFIS